VSRPTTRIRLLEAAVACIERQGLGKTSVDDVAGQAGLSRATVYRHFPGGRDELVSETIGWEVAQFLQRLADAVAPEPGLQAKLVRGLMVGHRAIDEHLLLQRVLSTEPETFFVGFQATLPVMGQLVEEEMRRLLGAERLRPGVAEEDAADYLTHLFLSYLGSPGDWDLGDRDAVERLVRTQFLAGVVELA
jgi:AcrR family transcriptional regulator